MEGSLLPESPLVIVTEIIWLPITDDATRIAALLSGEIDFVQDVPFQDIERLSQFPKACTDARGRLICGAAVGVDQYERAQALIEAGESFGASRRQLLWKVELPHALPTIMAGVTQCIMLSLSMVVIAALVGADGLGKPVVRALNTVNIARGFEAGLAIVLLAIMLDRLCKQPSESRRR